MASLIQYQKGNLEPELLVSLLQIRLMLEPPFARLAARNRTSEQILELHGILEKEAAANGRNPQALTDLDFEFHLLIALASGNRVYPLLLNSFRSVYTNLSGQFFRNTKVTDAVHGYHEKMVNAVESGNETRAASVMKAILNHGEKHLREMIGQESLSL
jgi:GntR family negative regulator for fad regulon and positive regulator of fabA